MTQPYLGQIEMFGFGFAPKSWAMCNGQLLPIQQNQALFSLLGTTYGGNGTTNFALPNLQSRVPLGYGTPVGGPTYTQGETGGEESNTLLMTEMPQHNHLVSVNTSVTANANTPAAGTALGNGTAAGTQPSGQPFTISLYGTTTPNGTLYGPAIANNGSNNPHSNLMPYLCVNFCISLSGIFPSRN